MVSSKATTVAAYLASLPAERRKEIAAVRKAVQAGMPKGYQEVMNWGMICWEIPLTTYPDTYNGQPLCYAALAAQKQHLSLYLMGAYLNVELVTALKEGFKARGKKLSMGKSCIRFKTADDLPLPVISKVVAATPPARYIVRYEQLNKKRK